MANVSWQHRENKLLLTQCSIYAAALGSELDFGCYDFEKWKIVSHWKKTFLLYCEYWH